MTDTSTSTVLSPREEWTTAVQAVAEQAKAVLPESHTRIDKAVQIVLGDGIELLDGGKARVTSQSSDGTQYHVANGECSCHDYEFQAPAGWCKHRLARALYLRAARMIEDTTAAMEETPAVDTPSDIPPQHIVMIQGKPFIKFAGLLQMAHARGLVSLSASFISVTPELALAHATAVFSDGRTFSEAADATPANVGIKVKAHFARMALTRAKARCLRDGLNIGMCSLEELGGD